jgi:hypothetical protein
VPILRDIPITLTAEEVIAAQGERRIRPRLLSDASEAIALGQTLWQPQIVYDWFDVRAVEGEYAYLLTPDHSDGEIALHLGPKADLLDSAERVIVSVVTIGPGLEEHVQELQSTGDSLQAYLLDSVGVVALGETSEAVRCLVEETAAELGWGVGAHLSPGSLVGWRLKGQHTLCSLLPLEDIGVRLSKHHVLEPHKSASGLVGIGPGYERTTVGSVCKWCALKDTCWRRRKDES